MQTSPTALAGAVCYTIELYIINFQKSSCSQFCGKPMAFLSIVGYALNKSISLSLNVFPGDIKTPAFQQFYMLP